MNEELRILMIEDVLTDAELELRELKRAGLRVSHRLVETEAAFRFHLDEFRPEIIISDFSMPHFDGMHALAIAREVAPDAPFIFVSGTIGEEYAIRALRNGATDYVLKNNLVRLPAAVERALQDREVHAARRIAEEEIKRQQAFLRQVIDLDRSLIFAKDREGRFVLVNQAVAELFGTSVDAMLGKTLDDFNLEKSQAERLRADDLEVMRTLREKFLSEDRIIDAAGRERWFQIVKRPIIGLDGKSDMMLGVATDITERKSQEQKIARLSRIHAVLSGINSAIVRIRDRQQLFDEACRIAVDHGGFGIAWIGALDPATQAVDPVASAGLETDSFLAHSQNLGGHRTTLGKGMVGNALKERMVKFSNDLTQEDLSTSGSRRREALRRGYRSVIVLPLLVEGAVFGNLSLFAREPNFFDDEEIKLLTELADDISFALEHIAKEEKLNYLVYYSPLTGLPNRALFNDWLEQRISTARDGKHEFSVILLDVERFRLVNDTLGRSAGDELLRELSHRLKAALQPADLLAHFGGDHFGVATHRAGESGTSVHLLEQVLTGLSGLPFHISGSELRVAVKAGVSIYPADGTDVDGLIRNAEAALENAKNTASPYQFYAPQMNARVAEQLKLESDLRNALQLEQYILHYQPKFDLASRQMVGMEALIRWMHPERGLVPPVQFISVLEETGMILDVGRWALKRAGLEHAAWCEQGFNPPRIAVNVSQVQLRRKDFVDYVKDALAGVRQAGQRVDLEITESMLMEDVEGSITKLRAVQEMGLNVAIDDFGTGYSSLSCLARLPIDSLKIDRSFIVQMPGSPEQMAIVSTVISLGRALNLKVVAEGVETEEQANLLRLLRCDEVQGYMFGRPMPSEDIERLLPRA